MESRRRSADDWRAARREISEVFSRKKKTYFSRGFWREISRKKSLRDFSKKIPPREKFSRGKEAGRVRNFARSELGGIRSPCRRGRGRDQLARVCLL